MRWRADRVAADQERQSELELLRSRAVRRRGVSIIVIWLSHVASRHVNNVSRCAIRWMSLINTRRGGVMPSIERPLVQHFQAEKPYFVSCEPSLEVAPTTLATFRRPEITHLLLLTYSYLQF